MKSDRPDLHPRPRPNFVYFARGHTTKLIKIGYSHNPSSRASCTYREHGESVTILFTVKGGRAKESAFHKRFKEYESKREWFHEGERLHAFLKARGHHGQLYKKLPDPPPVKDGHHLVLPRRPVVEYGPTDDSCPELIGYARVSTAEQNLDMQIAMLKKEGVKDEFLFVEKLSATNAKRPKFHLMMKGLQTGDTLVVYSVSRLARDVRTLHKICDDLKRIGVTLRSITEPHMDTATPEGRLMFTVKGAIDQFEREQTQRRTRHGLAERKRQGMYLGAPRVITPEKVRAMKNDLKRPNMTVKLVAKKHGVSVASVYGYLKGGKKAVKK